MRSMGMTTFANKPIEVLSVRALFDWSFALGWPPNTMKPLQESDPYGVL
jgi:hypothetical protein